MEQPPGVAPEQLRTLDRLKALPPLAGFYLAGGTAVAHHRNHRRSLDLDLFSAAPDADLEPARLAVFGAFGDTQTVSVTDVTVRLRAGDCAIDLVRYPYPPLEPTAAGPAGFPVASLPDLAAMKLATIARRGLRRDFWDLKAILEGGQTLRDAARAYVARYGVREADLYHVLRALTYFADAEKESVMPVGLSVERWEAMKAFFLREAPGLLAAQ